MQTFWKISPAVLAGCGQLFLLGVAAAAPQVPQAPAVIWSEDFEQTSPVPSTGVSLLAYSGSAIDGSPMTYTADPSWLPASGGCNGIIASSKMTTALPSGCNFSGPGGAWATVKQLSYALGAFSQLKSLINTGATVTAADFSTIDWVAARDNSAVAAYTQGPSPVANSIFFKTNRNIPFNGIGRFLTTSIDVGAVSCTSSGATPARLKFSLIDSSNVEKPLNTIAINACDIDKVPELTVPDVFDSSSGTPVLEAAGRTVRVRTVYSSGAIPFAGSSVGFVARNETNTGSGNDYAFDNPSILEVTPHLDKEFSQTSVYLGDVVNLVITITNRTDLAQKTGWTFTDTLNSNLVVAGPATSTCSGAVVAAAGQTISVTNGSLISGSSYCTITVPVKALSVGTWGETTTASSFIIPNAGNTLTVTPGADMVATPTAPENFGVGVKGAIATACVNNGPDIATSATCIVTNAPPDAETICTPTSGTANLKLGESITCVTSFTMTSPGTVELTTRAGSSATDPDHTNDEQQVVVTAVSPAADMQADGPPNVTVNVGQVVSVTSACTNKGPNAAVNATCTVTGAPSDAQTICEPASPLASLAMGASMSCVTTFKADTAGAIALTTTAGTSTAEINSKNNFATTDVTVTNTSIAPVPTLAQWAVVLLSAAVGGFAWTGFRRRRLS